MSTIHRLSRMLQASVLAVGLITPVGGVVAAETGIGAVAAQPVTAQSDPAKSDAALPASTSSPAVVPVQAGGNKVDAATEEILEQASFSMQLHKAPLLQMLSLSGASSPVRFRYAAPPDAVITTTLQDAPLLSTLENLLHSVGFTTHRDGLDIFICGWGDEPHITRNTSTLPVAWQIWTRRVPPPSRWMAPLPLPNRPRVDTQDQWQMEKSLATAAVGVAWRPAKLNFEAGHRPGIAVDATSVADGRTGEMVYLRWNLTLNQVPRGAQLLLETPHEATLYVNGAPLLRRFRHIRLVDLGEVLRTGDNCLAIALRRVHLNQSSVAAGSKEVGRSAVTGRVPNAGSSPAGKQGEVLMPILRYEWFFGGDS